MVAQIVAVVRADEPIRLLLQPKTLDLRVERRVRIVHGHQTFLAGDASKTATCDGIDTVYGTRRLSAVDFDDQNREDLEKGGVDHEDDLEADYYEEIEADDMKAAINKQEGGMDWEVGSIYERETDNKARSTSQGGSASIFSFRRLAEAGHRLAAFKYYGGKHTPAADIPAEVTDAFKMKGQKLTNLRCRAQGVSKIGSPKFVATYGSSTTKPVDYFTRINIRRCTRCNTKQIYNCIGLI